MSLKSNLFKGVQPLEAAAVSNPAHILRGARGSHVARLQRALFLVDAPAIDRSEIAQQVYGASTEAAVLKFKTQRNIVNRSYQNAPDGIVGVMTMKALDEEVLAVEQAADEAAVWCAIATALGYNPRQQRVVTYDMPLRSTVSELQRK